MALLGAPYIYDISSLRVNQELASKYKTVEERLKKKYSTCPDKNPVCKGSFYPRVINKTNITFTNDELILLNKGLKYDLNHKHKNSCPGS